MGMKLVVKVHSHQDTQYVESINQILFLLLFFFTIKRCLFALVYKEPEKNTLSETKLSSNFSIRISFT